MLEPDKETLGFYSGSLYKSYYLGVIGPGFLNQVPTLGFEGSTRVWGLGFKGSL